MAVIQEATQPSDLILYTFLRDSFNAKLDEYHLLYLYDLPLTTLVTDLIHQVVNNLQQSSFAYQFSGNTRGSFCHMKLFRFSCWSLSTEGRAIKELILSDCDMHLFVRAGHSKT